MKGEPAADWGLPAKWNKTSKLVASVTVKFRMMLVYFFQCWLKRLTLLVRLASGHLPILCPYLLMGNRKSTKEGLSLLNPASTCWCSVFLPVSSAFILSELDGVGEDTCNGNSQSVLWVLPWPISPAREGAERHPMRVSLWCSFSPKPGRTCCRYVVNICCSNCKISSGTWSVTKPHP